MTSDHDLYAVLDIPSEADHDDIKAAYYRQVRKHPPEKDAAGFRRVQEAFDILGNPETRKEYDEQRRSDPHTRKLVEQGRKLLDESDPEAVTPLKRALVRQPDSTVIRDLLVQALLLDEDYEDAEKQARVLVSQAPDNPAYHLRLGDVLRADDQDEEAEEPYRTALELDDETPQPVTKLAYLLNYLGREDEAIEVLRDAILRDGRVDFEDFLFFQALCRIYVGLDDTDSLAIVHTEIRQILPPDPETRGFVAWFYYTDALVLTKRKKFDAALAMIEEAASIDDSLPELASTRNRIRQSKSALDEASRLREDESILAELRYSLGTLVIMRVLEVAGDMEEVHKSATAALGSHMALEASPLKLNITMVRRKYPNLGRVVKDFLESLEKALATTPKTKMVVRCPRCRDEGISDIPTLQSLADAGFSPEQVVVAFMDGGLQQAKRLMVFTCTKCGALHNGLSERIGEQGRPTSIPTGVPRLFVDQGSRRVLVWLLLIGVFVVVGDYLDDGDAKKTASSRPTPAALQASPAQQAMAPTMPRIVEWHVTGASLNVRSGPGTAHSKIAQLKRFDTIVPLEQPVGGWARVQLSDGSTGFVSTQALAQGSGAAARLQWCVDNAGARPSNGHVFTRSRKGPHTLTIKNEPGRDAVFKLKNSKKDTVLAFYVRSGDAVMISDAPEGIYFPVYATGHSYSNACGVFLEGQSVSKPDTRLDFLTTQKGGYVYSATWELTLYRVEGGNLQMKPASVDDFLDE